AFRASDQVLEDGAPFVTPPRALDLADVHLALEERCCELAESHLLWLGLDGAGSNALLLFEEHPRRRLPIGVRKDSFDLLEPAGGRVRHVGPNEMTSFLQSVDGWVLRVRDVVFPTMNPLVHEHLLAEAHPDDPLHP